VHSIKVSWKKIISWYGTNGLRGPLSLGPGASGKEISNLESLVGMALPYDVRESLRLHNGTTDLGGVFSYGYYLLTIEEISKAWKEFSKGVKRGVFNGMDDLIEVKGPIKKTWWNTKWIPITGSGGGDFRCIDMDPADNGKIGQIIYFNHEAGPKRVEALSWTEYLSDFADGLENGRFRLNAEGTVVPNE
jgi:cell wall assembly regulator SMI1